MKLLTTLAFTIAAPLSSQQVPDSASVSPDSAGLWVIPHEQLNSLPALQDPRGALGLVPGVVLRQSSDGLDDFSSLSVRRASRPPSIYIDGAPATFQTLGIGGVVPDINAIERLSLTTGVSPASVRDVAGGVLDYRLGAGRKRLGGEVRARADGPVGGVSRAGYHDFDATAGGPLGGRLSWDVSGMLRGQRTSYRGLGAEDFLTYQPGGVDTVVGGVAIPSFGDQTGPALPLDWITSRQAHAKLALSYGDSSSLSLTAFGGDQQRRLYPGSAIMDSALSSGARQSTGLLVLNWRHVTGPVGAGQLAFSMNLSAARERQVEGVLDSLSERSTRDPSLGMQMSPLRFVGPDSLPFPLDNRIIDQVRSNTGGHGLRFPNRNDLRLSQPFRLNPYGFEIGFPTAGADGGLTMVAENRLNARAELEWKGASGSLLGGVELGRTLSSYYESSSLISNANLDLFLAHPRQEGLYAAATIHRGPFDLEAGIRVDHFNGGLAYPTVPGRTFSNPSFPSGVFTQAQSHSAASPRMGATFLAGSTRLHLGWGREATMPVFRRLFAGANTDLSFASPGSKYGRDVSYVVSDLLDAGVQQRMGPAILNLDAYYRAGLGDYIWGVTSIEDPYTGILINEISLRSLDSISITGLEGAVVVKPAPSLSVMGQYSVSRVNQPSTPAIFPFPPREGSPGSTQSISMLLDLQWPAPAGGAHGMVWKVFSGIRVTATARAISGLPYTRQVNAGLGLVVPEDSLALGNQAEPLYSSRLPWTHSIDLRVMKTFSVAGMRAGVFADFRNLFNRTNTVSLYSETGSETNGQFLGDMIGYMATGLRSEASAFGALESDGSTLDLRGCGGWGTRAPDCVSLVGVEARFGNGDKRYTLPEQQAAANSFFNLFYGAWRFHGPGRVAQVGVEIRF